MDLQLEDYKSKGTEYFPIKFLSENKIRTVELIMDKQGILYARKKIPNSDDGPTRGENFYFIREVTLLYQAQVKRLPFAKLVEYQIPTIQEDGFIITEYMKGGNLMELINKEFNHKSPQYVYNSNNIEDPFDRVPFISNYENVHIDYNNTRKNIIMYGVAIAIRFLHHNSIYHRDIKPENILLDENGDPYLSDFGLARRVLQKNQDILSGQKGTVPYMAPEIFLSNIPEISGDIYAFGVTVLMILSGDLKFEKNGKLSSAFVVKRDTLINEITHGTKYVIPENIPNNFKGLIERCCRTDPGTRPSIDDIINDFESGSLNLPDINVLEFKNYMDRFQKEDDEK